MMRSSSARAFVVQLARRGAVLRVIENRRKTSLQFPRREEERPVDVGNELLERHVASTRRPRNAGVGERLAGPVDLEPIRRAPLRRAAAAARAGRRAARAAASAARGCRVRTPAARSSLSRLDTTSTTRDASSTCTVVRPYSGATFTAVCCGLVVAPPMSSGSRSLPALHLLAPRTPSRRATA